MEEPKIYEEFDKSVSTYSLKSVLSTGNVSAEISITPPDPGCAPVRALLGLVKQRWTGNLIDVWTLTLTTRHCVSLEANVRVCSSITFDFNEDIMVKMVCDDGNNYSCGVDVSRFFGGSSEGLFCIPICSVQLLKVEGIPQPLRVERIKTNNIRFYHWYLTNWQQSNLDTTTIILSEGGNSVELKLQLDKRVTRENDSEVVTLTLDTANTQRCVKGRLQIFGSCSLYLRDDDTEFNLNKSNDFRLEFPLKNDVSNNWRGWRIMSMGIGDIKIGPPCVRSLSSDLQRLHVSQAHSDCVLRVKDAEFPAHKAILSARSSFFDTLLRNETSPFIADVSPEEMEQLLTFVYTDQVPRLEEMAEQLVALADVWSMPRLMQVSEGSLLNLLDQGNVVRLLALAGKHRLTLLEKEARQFLETHAEDLLDIAQ